MASPGEVDEVRLNTDISADDDTFTFALINGYVDSLGIAGATAKLWEQKAAMWAGLVDVTEAGGTERLGQLIDRAQAQVKYWNSKVTAEVSSTGRARTHALARDSA